MVDAILLFYHFSLISFAITNKTYKKNAKTMIIDILPFSLFILTGNGVMDFQEFVKLMSKKNHFGMNVIEAKEAFRIFDRDDRGYVLTSELRQAFGRFKERISDNEHDEILEDKCQAGNRKVSFEGIR